MGLKMLNARLVICDGMKRYGNRPECLPITRELLDLDRTSSQSYKAHLENERPKKDEMEARRKEEEEKLAKQKENEHLIASEKKKIEALEENLKDIKSNHTEQRKVTDKLIEEANENLKKAIKAKDLVEIGIAQAMVEAATKRLSEERETAKKNECIKQKVLKRQASLISSLLF